MKLPSRKLLFRFAAVVVGCIVALALVEGIATACAWFQFHTINVAELNERDAGNAFGNEIAEEWKGFAETVRPHPWLGIVPSDVDPDIRWQRVTKMERFPTEKDPKKFTVLLTGGSVALLMGVSGDGPKTFLEEALSRYDFGGREVVVLNAAEGGCSQPRQAIAAMMYADVADAVINLDGFNESTRLGRGGSAHFRLDAPAGWFWEFNVLASNAYERLGASWQNTQLRRFSMSHNSRALFFVTRFARRWIEASAPEQNVARSRQPFQLPKDWTEQQFCDFNIRQYQKYIRSIDALAKLNGAKSAFFIQPCPAIDKTLTDEERRVVGPLDYVDAYQNMNDKLLSLREENIPIVSLLDLYSQETETVYCDPCHCRRNSRGYRMMADSIAAHAAELWSLKPSDQAN